MNTATFFPGGSPSTSPTNLTISSASKPGASNPQMIWLDELTLKNPADLGSGYADVATIRDAVHLKKYPFKVFVGARNCHLRIPKGPTTRVIAVMKGEEAEDRDVEVQEAWTLNIKEARFTPIPLSEITCGPLNKW